MDNDSTDKEFNEGDILVDKRWRRRILKAESWSTTLCSKFIVNICSFAHTLQPLLSKICSKGVEGVEGYKGIYKGMESIFNVTNILSNPLCGWFLN